MSDTTPPPPGGQPQPTPEQPAYAQPQPQQLPPAPGQAVASISPNDERTWGMIAHAGALAATVLSGGTLGFVVALVIYLVYKDRGPFVRYNAANALNVQITAGIGVIVGIILCLTIIGLIIGIPLILLSAGYAIVVHIIGAVKANNGEWWTPPLTPQFVK